MKHLWKVLLPAFVLALVLALGACGGGAEEPAPTPTPGPTPAVTPTPGPGPAETPGPGADPTPAPPPSRNLGGLEIIVANWWTEYDTDTFEPTTFAQRERWEDRRYVEERYNFRIREIRMGDWDDMNATHALHLATRNPDWHVIALAPNWHANMAPRGFFAPIPQTWFTEGYGGQQIWNEGSMGFAALAAPPGYTYGFPTGAGIPIVGGMVYNMRLLEEAGFPRHYIFDLQARGEWNWDAFERISRQIMIAFDDGTGVPTVFPHAGFNQEFLARAVFANGAQFVYLCPDTGVLRDGTTSPEFHEALQWSMTMRDMNFIMDESDFDPPLEWNFWMEWFNTGRAVFRSLTHGHAIDHVAPELADDWGFVAFPFGPSSPGNRHWSYSTGGTLLAIPAVHADLVDDIMFAMMRWNRPLGGDDEDDEDDWIYDQLAIFPEERSVRETMALFNRVAEYQRISWHEMLPGDEEIWRNLFAWRIWGNREEFPDASTVLEASRGEWTETIATSNRNLGLE